MKNIIVMEEDRDYIPNMDLYSFVEEEYRYNNPFVVCHVTDDEYELMEKSIKKFGVLPERTASIHEYGYDRNRYMMGNNLMEGIVEIASYESDANTIGSYYLENGEIKYDTDSYQFTSDITRNKGVSLLGYRVYTTETFNDVINYYTELKNSKVKESGPVLKKTIE